MRPTVHVLTIVTLAGWLSLDVSKLRTGLSDFFREVRSLDETIERRHALEAQEKDLLALTEAKQRVAREVIAGRLSLRDAASRFRTICLSSPAFHMDVFKRRFQGHSEEERYTRALIAEAEYLLATQPEQARVILPPLKVKLDELGDSAARQHPL
jgi:hypothetical protein